MPLVIIRGSSRVTNGVLMQLLDTLPAVVAESLSCGEGRLTAKDIMIEVQEANWLDRNTKDVNIRILAHDYVERHLQIDRSQQYISGWVQKQLPGGVSWYVWLVLSTTSYGSDTMS